MYQQAVRGNQQQFEKHEQVEQIAGKEGAVQAHPLQPEQFVEKRAAFIPVADSGVGLHFQRQQSGQYQHPGR